MYPHQISQYPLEKNCKLINVPGTFIRKTRLCKKENLCLILLIMWVGGFKKRAKCAYVIKVWPPSAVPMERETLRSGRDGTGRTDGRMTLEGET